MILAKDKRTWKVVGFLAAMIIVIALLPVMVLLAIGNQLSSAETQDIDYSAYVQNLSVQQKERLTQMESDGKAIADELSKLGLKTQTVKAQMIYLTYFENVSKSENFFKDYCACFKEKDNKKLIENLNKKYGLKISYEEFMRSYSVIANVSIDSNLFLNLDVKNNIDLARWAENAYTTQRGYVPYKWQSRRTTDNYNLLRSYLWYDSKSRTISKDNYSISDMTVQELYNSASVKGSMDKLPDTVGTAVINGDIIGIYIGGGNVVYAKSVTDGMVKESVKNSSWKAWFEIPWIEYGEEKNFNNEIQFDEYDKKKKNNLGLVQWAIQAHENGWGYVYGTYGNVLTESILQDRASVFGGEVTSYMDFIRSNWLGKRTADCVGLIKGYGWYDNKSGKITVGSNGMADVGANGMFENAKVKGTIDTIPEVPGLAVWSDGHIGIYIGNGEVIEAMNTLRGVTRTKLAGREWTHWLQIPYISYVEEKEKK